MPLSTLPLLVLLAMAQGQRVTDVSPTPAPRPSEPLLAYRGADVAVRYSPGALDRAVHVANRLDLVIGELKESLGVVLPLTVVVLSRDEWEREDMARVYGLPQPLSMGSIAVPASGDEETVRRWKTWLGTELPDVGGVPMVGTAEDASTLMLSDLVLQVEVCELVLDRTPVAAAEPWIRGLLSHLAALSLWSDFEPSRMAEIEMIWTRIRGQIPPLLALEPRRLQENAPPLNTERWLLAESHLFDGANRVYVAGGTKTLRKLLKSVARDEKPPTREQLLALYPPLQGWLDSLPTEAGIR